VKVGNLVCLSSYGRRRHYNANLMNDPSQVGVILEVGNLNMSYPYKVMWTKSKTYTHRGLGSTHCRRELKYAYKHKNND